MRLGVQAPWLDRDGGRAYLLTLGAAAEELGIESIWVGEHIVSVEDPASAYPYSADGKAAAASAVGMAEPVTALSFLAAVTFTVRLGTAVCLLPQRNPVYLAKETAALDVLSGGRLELGVGVGWLREEFAAIGAEWLSRGRRTDEYIGVLRDLWREDGDRTKGYRIQPPPLQQPGPRIHIGGNGPAALRRVAALGDGWMPFRISPEDLADGLRTLEAELSGWGRHRGDVEVSVCTGSGGTTAERIEAFAAAGVDRLVASAPATDPDGLRQYLDDLADLFGRHAG